MIGMAIKYVVIPEKKTVIALLENTQYDAYNKVMKICRDIANGQNDVYICPNSDKLMMPCKFKVAVVCRDGDVFDEKIGKAIAKKRCLKKYYSSFDKKVNNFKKSLGRLHI